MPASIELKELVAMMKMTDKESLGHVKNYGEKFIFAVKRSYWKKHF
jgi:hypothetical protein